MKFQVEEALSCLRLTIPIMRRVQKVFLDEMNRGLAQKPSSLQMENTYLPELPDGTGNYLHFFFSKLLINIKLS